MAPVSGEQAADDLTHVDTATVEAELEALQTVKSLKAELEALSQFIKVMEVVHEQVMVTESRATCTSLLCNLAFVGRICCWNLAFLGRILAAFAAS